MTRGGHLERYGGMQGALERGAGQSLPGLVSRLTAFFGRTGIPDLSGLIVSTRRYEQDQPAWAERGDLSHICVLEEGWAYKFCFFPDGRRHIPDFFGPGAICNWSALGNFVDQDDILFKAGSRVSFLDRRALEAMMLESPAIGSAIRRHELARTMRVTQRVRAFITLTAEQKFLLLLLDIASEISPRTARREWHKMPFLNIEIADCLGITPVHVSRISVKLEQQGLVERQGSRFRLNETDTIEHALSYRDFFRPGPR